MCVTYYGMFNRWLIQFSIIGLGLGGGEQILIIVFPLHAELHLLTSKSLAYLVSAETVFEQLSRQEGTDIHHE